MVFSNPEEEVFYKEADASCEFNVSSESDTAVSGKWTEDDAEMVPFRRLILFKAQKLPSIIEKVKNFIGYGFVFSFISLVMQLGSGYTIPVRWGDLMACSTTNSVRILALRILMKS